MRPGCASAWPPEDSSKSFQFHYLLVCDSPQLNGGDEGRRDFSQRYQHKGTLHHARMRHRQVLRIDRAPSVKQNIKIKSSRRIEVRSFAACRLLNALEFSQELRRCE